MKCLDFSVKNAFSGWPVRALRLLLAGLWLVLAGNALAVEVTGLYQGAVIVASRDSEQERRRAFSETLRQVLIKVSGRNDIVTQPQVRRALGNAADFVDTWSYRNLAVPEGETDATATNVNRIEISVTFFEPQVRSLLDASGIALWPSNRPYTLVWLVVQDELGERRLLGSSSTGFPILKNLLDTESVRRGLPVLLPILDFEDMRAASVEDVWNMDVEKLLAASSRYQSESVLVMRLFRTLGGEVVARSYYLFRGQVLELETFEGSSESFIRDSINLAAEELAAYYAVLLSGTDSSIRVHMTVDGIHSAEDYAGLLDYVSRLTGINGFQVAAVNSETIELRLTTGGQLRQLVETIALNRDLLPRGDLVRDDNEVFMHYQWNR